MAQIIQPQEIPVLKLPNADPPFRSGLPYLLPLPWVPIVSERANEWWDGAKKGHNRVPGADLRCPPWWQISNHKGNSPTQGNL